MHAPSLLLSLFLLLAACAPAVASDDAAAAAAGATFEAALAAYGSGTGDLDAVYRWSARWRDAAGDVAGHRARMAALEEQVIARHAQGMASELDRRAALFYRLEAAGR